MIQKMKGTEDILPQTINRWHYIEDVARDIFESYHFSEIRTPMFEAVELFNRSVGDTSDIVTKEMYNFKDKGNRDIALRPEGTAPVVRAFVEHKLFGPEHPQPLKVYYMGPMFRYERPQSGRQRQFNQLGVEVLGSTNPAIDVETIALAWDFFSELGVKNIKIYMNSLGKPQDRMTYRQALVDYFKPHFEELSDDSKSRLESNPLRILDSKDPKDKALVKGAPVITDYLCPESRTHFDKVQEMLTILNIPYEIDPYIVRGLDYYQDTIFEIIVEDQSIGAQSTICGGGRYDGLVEQLGGPKAPGFGFAIGMERLLLLLDQQEIEIENENQLDVYVMSIGEEAVNYALQLVQAARKDGLRADRDYLDRSIKSQFKTLTKYETNLLVTIGEEEISQGQVQVKNLDTGKVNYVKFEEIMTDFNKVYRANTMDTSVIDKFFKGEME